MDARLIRSRFLKTGILLLGLVFAAAAFVIYAPFTSAGPAKRKAVVVELFTSEGCSSCPPADELLGRLSGQKSVNGAQIIPLGFHVDYWDHQGWRDRFSSHDYTERQQHYADQFKIDGPYTPQMVVDGSAQFVGSSSGRAQEAIAQAAAQPQQAEVQLTIVPDAIAVQVKAADTSLTGNVMMAMTQDNQTTNVGGGENGGRVLHHSAVVREFQQIGKLVNGSFAGSIPRKKDLHCVVFVQSPATGSILGAAALPL